MVLNGGADERAAIQWEMNMWLRKRGDDKVFERSVVKRRGKERSFGDHVKRERIFSDDVGKRGGDSLTVRFGDEIMENGPFQGQVMGKR
jgi:hypothetical protein